MKNIILSVLLWAVASVSMALTLPTSSYSSGIMEDAGTEAFLGTGVKMNSFNALKSTNINKTECTTEGVSGDPTWCGTCCTYIFDRGGDQEDYKECVNSCINGYSLGESPLGEVLLLLPFALAYAFIRRRKQA